MSNDSKYRDVIEILRAQAGARLHELENAGKSSQTPETLKRLAEVWDEFGQITGFFSGYLFGLKSTLPPDQFEAVLRTAEVDKVELKDLTNIAAKFTRAIKRAERK